MSVGPAEPGKRILVVDDEDLVRTFVVSVLRSSGFETLEAANADAAMEILDAGQPIDLLFTDIVMPGSMTGVELAKKARTESPHLKVVLMSGYPGEALQGLGFPDGTTPYLPKPFRVGDLLAKVRSLLGSRPLAKPEAPLPILIVDDYEPDLKALSVVLSDAGYEVIVAGNAAAAIDIIFNRPDVALVVTDVKMPRTDGIALAAMAASRRPGIKILYLTAYGETLRDLPDIKPSQWLEKPCKAEDLRARVRAALA